MECALDCLAEKSPSICSAYSSSSSLRWGKRNTTPLDILLKAADHSAPVLTCLFDSAMANTTSVAPTQPFLSSSRWTKCMVERIWLRSTDSPRSIRSHWEDGIPSGRSLATRKRDLTPDRSSLNCNKVRQVSAQLVLRADITALLYHGISSSFAHLLTTLGPSSSSSRSPLETCSKISSTSSLILLDLPPGSRVVSTAGEFCLASD